MIFNLIRHWFERISYNKFHKLIAKGKFNTYISRNIRNEKHAIRVIKFHAHLARWQQNPSNYNNRILRKIKEIKKQLED